MVSGGCGGWRVASRAPFQKLIVTEHRLIGFAGASTGTSALPDQFTELEAAEVAALRAEGLWGFGTPINPTVYEDPGAPWIWNPMRYAAAELE
jgi:hypothetical protein